MCISFKCDNFNYDIILIGNDEFKPRDLSASASGNDS